MDPGPVGIANGLTGISIVPLEFSTDSSWSEETDGAVVRGSLSESKRSLFATD